MTLIFYNAILILGIREGNEIIWQAVGLTLQLVQNISWQKYWYLDSLLTFSREELQEPEVFVDVFWLLVSREAGLASLCLQWPLEIALADSKEPRSTRVLPHQLRSAASVWQMARVASCVLRRDDPQPASSSSLMTELVLDSQEAEASWDGISHNLYYMQKRLWVYSQAVVVYLPC